MKELKLTNSTTPVIVEDCDYDRLVGYAWSVAGNGLGMIRRTYRDGSKIETVPLANEVMQERSVRFDHKDRNPYNNLRDNLRPASHSQNAMNRNKIGGTSSKYKGVCWTKRNQKWAASIKLRQRQIWIGYFETEEQAAIAYNNRATKLFGEFAVLNVI